ncbi:MAG: hypothetical protein B7Y90_10550 [Alphaproteobacteria bacterium 32-64-14]|nr:MAG: hypothetical protein B7Y90_10550 [Alphaproteobacteria bacterium 32-64-14]
MWWWGILNWYQATGFLLAAGGSFLMAPWWSRGDYEPGDLGVVAFLIVPGLGICLRNKFNNNFPSEIEKARELLRKDMIPIFWPGLVVFCVAAIAGQVARVWHFGLSPVIGLILAATICAAGAAITGIILFFNWRDAEARKRASN